MIVPAYNEEERVAQTLTGIAEYLKAGGYAFEILVLNDGSSDATARKVREAASRCPEIRLIDRKENLGKGTTVKEGIAHANYPICLFMDADNSTSIREWDKFEKRFDEGFKVVIASRHLPGSKILTPQPWMRRVLGTGYRILCRALFGLKGSDFNCGFKAYETPIAKEIYAQTQMRDWTFDAEVFCLLKRRGLAFAEVPVSWTHYGKPSHLPPLKTAFKSLESLFQLRKRTQEKPR